jgi:hypothetical protein
MGFLNTLFGFTGNERTKIKSSLEILEDSLNQEFEKCINRGDDIFTVKYMLQNVAEDIRNQHDTDLNAKPANIWKCQICECLNTGGVTICTRCKIEFGKWRCPLCGRIHIAELYRCECKFNWETWIQCQVCNKWYNERKFKKCSNC